MGQIGGVVGEVDGDAVGGQRIVDTFVDTCTQKCRGQLTTLSVIDLAEVEATLPDALASFSKSTTGQGAEGGGVCLGACGADGPWSTTWN